MSPGAAAARVVAVEPPERVARRNPDVSGTTFADSDDI